MSGDSSVGIATHYGLDGPWIESLLGRDFPHTPTPALDLPSLLWSRQRVSLPGLKRSGRHIDHAKLRELAVHQLLWSFMALSRASFAVFNVRSAP
jgi:hypothetical protein